MQSVAQSIVKIQGKNEISMHSAWIRHEFNTNLISITVQNIVQFTLRMKSAWNHHEVGMKSISITVQSIVKKSVYKSFSKHNSLSVSYSNLTLNSDSPTKKHGLAPNSKPPTQTTSFISVESIGPTVDCAIKSQCGRNAIV